MRARSGGETVGEMAVMAASRSRGGQLSEAAATASLAGMEIAAVPSAGPAAVHWQSSALCEQQLMSEKTAFGGESEAQHGAGTGASMDTSTSGARAPRPLKVLIGRGVIRTRSPYVQTPSSAGEFPDSKTSIRRAAAHLTGSVDRNAGYFGDAGASGERAAGGVPPRMVRMRLNMNRMSPRTTATPDQAPTP